MANDTLNATGDTGQSDYEQRRDRIQRGDFSAQGKDDDIRQAINAWFNETPSDPGEITGYPTKALEVFFRSEFGSDPDAAAAINNYLEGADAGTVQFDGASSIGTVTVAGEPIDLATGQFVHSVTDFAVAGAGIDFVFARTYRSGANYYGPMGASWDHAYNLWLRVNPDNSISITSGRLREILYFRHEFFPYYLAIGDENVVVATVDKAFEQRSPDGRIARFEQVGDAIGTIYRMVSITDRFGNWINFSYDNQIRLSTATVNHAARTVAFAYDDQSRIVSMTLFPVTYMTGRGTAPIQRIWTYTYDDFSDLVAVTGPGTDEYPAGRTTQYAYSSPSAFAQRQHDLLSITDANGTTFLENEYGGAAGTVAYGKVVRQRVGGGVFLFDYAQVIPDPSWSFTAAERPSTCVTVVQRDGYPVRYVLNAIGNILAAQETVLGAGEEVVVWRYAYDGDGRRIAMLSPEGRVTQIYYGREDFYRRAIAPGDTSVPMWQDPNLSATEHACFGNAIATIRRSRLLQFAGQLDDVAIYGAIFPDPLVVLADDIIVKRTYEAKFQQLATTSDPRHTAAPDPAAPESLDPNSPYSRHLTLTTFNGDAAATPAAIIYPDTTYPAPLPNGSTGVVRARQSFDAYDANGRLQHWTEPAGNAFANDYFPASAAQPTIEGFLAASVTSAGVLNLRTTFAVNEAGQVIGVTDPLNHAAQFALDPCTLLRKVTLPIPGYTIEYHHDGNGQVTSRAIAIIEPDGSAAPGSPEIATFLYSEEMSVVLAAVGDSSPVPPRRTQRVYNSSNRLVRIVNPRGNWTCFEYDERSLVRRITRGCCTAAAAATTFGHDLDELCIATTDPRGHTSSTRLDAFGRAIETTDAHGNRQRTDYDKQDHAIVQRQFGSLQNGAYPLLWRSEHLYDERGQLIRIRRALFQRPIPTADPSGAPDTEFDAAAQNGAVQFYDTLIFVDGNLRVFQVVDANGNATAVQYDDANRVIAVTDAAGSVVNATFDAACNVTRLDRYMVDASGTTRAVVSTVYEFDALNRLAATTDGAGNRLTRGLDSRGLLRQITDALGHVTTHSYNGFRERIQTTEVLLPLPGGGPGGNLTTSAFFDANGNIAGISDPAGNTTTFEYDALDRRISVTNPDGTSRSMQYDLSSNLTETVDEGGVIVRRTYDDLDRLTCAAVQYPVPVPHAAEQSLQFSYDGASALIGHANDFVTVTLTLDSLGRCYQEVQTFNPPLNALASPLSILRQFDPVSNRIGLTYPSGQTLHYEFGPDNRFLRLRSAANGAGYPGDPGAAANRLIVENLQAGDFTLSRHFGNGVTSTPAYDAAGRRIGEDCNLPNGDEYLLQQLWDGGDNRVLGIEKAAGSQSGWWHEYDSTDRLVASVSLPNPVPVTTGPLAPPLAPVPIGAFLCQQQIDGIVVGYGVIPSAPQIGYDVAGNRSSQVTQSGILSYSVNTRNEYSKVGPAAMSYDPAGRLAADANFDYAYNFRGQLVQASKPGGKAVLQVFHDALGRAAGVDEGGRQRVLAMDGADALEIYEGGTLSSLYLWEIADRLCFFAARGKDQYVLRDVLNSTRLTTDAGGSLIAFFRYDAFGSLVAGSPTAPFLYSGRFRYDSIGWYDYRNRQYVPYLGRFAQPDPAGFIEGTNLYTFAGNNPLSATDPGGTNRQDVARAGESLPPYAQGFLDQIVASVKRTGGGLKAFMVDNALGAYYRATNDENYKKYELERREYRDAVEDFLLAGPDAALRNSMRGMTAPLDHMKASLAKGDAAAAQRDLGRFMGNLAPSLLFAGDASSAPAPMPALAAAEGPVLSTGAAMGSVGGGDLLGPGLAFMATSKESGGKGSSPPDKQHWNDQEKYSADFGERETGKPFLREVELFTRKAGGPLEKISRRLDALSVDITTGRLVLHEWSTRREILLGARKGRQLSLQLQVFQEAKKTGATIWARPQGTHAFLDVTQAEHYIGTYLHWY